MTIEEYMAIALEQALEAQKKGEVPVGAIIIYDNKIISKAHNETVNSYDATAHAELIAIRDACKKLNQKRLDGAILVTTKEPCPMCASAMVLAHIKTLIYGCADSKMGAAGTVFNLVANSKMNHQIEVIAGVKNEECKQLLQNFFRKLRERKIGNL